MIEDISTLFKWKCRKHETKLSSDKLCKQRKRWGLAIARGNAPPYAPFCTECIRCEGPIRLGGQ